MAAVASDDPKASDAGDVRVIVGDVPVTGGSGWCEAALAVGEEDRAEDRAEDKAEDQSAVERRPCRKEMTFSFGKIADSRGVSCFHASLFLRACNRGGCSGWSQPVPVLTAPTALAGLELREQLPDRLEIAWRREAVSLQSVSSAREVLEVRVTAEGQRQPSLHLIELEERPSRAGCVHVRSSSELTLASGLCSGRSPVRHEVAARQVRVLSLASGLNVTLADEWSPVAHTDFKCSSQNGRPLLLSLLLASLAFVVSLSVAVLIFIAADKFNRFHRRLLTATKGNDFDVTALELPTEHPGRKLDLFAKRETDCIGRSVAEAEALTAARAEAARHLELLLDPICDQAEASLWKGQRHPACDDVDVDLARNSSNERLLTPEKCSYIRIGRV